MGPGSDLREDWGAAALPSVPHPYATPRQGPQP